MSKTIKGWSAQGSYEPAQTQTNHTYGEAVGDVVGPVGSGVGCLVLRYDDNMVKSRSGQCFQIAKMQIKVQSYSRRRR